MLFARVSDIAIGMCTCSSPPYPDIGIISTGDPIHIDIGLPVARVSDIVTFTCGTGIIVTGSFTDISTGNPVARTGDQVMGCGQGTIVSKSVHVTNM